MEISLVSVEALDEPFPASVVPYDLTHLCPTRLFSYHPVLAVKIFVKEN